MPQFKYTATTKSNEKRSGVITAKDEGEVRIILRSQGLRPVKIIKPSLMETDLGALFGGRVSQKEVLVFTRQLAVLLSSGVPLVQSLEIVGEQMKVSQMRSVILSMKEKITGGQFLWESMKENKKIFDEIYVNLVNAGEKSGKLDEILTRLAKYLEDAAKLRAMVVSALVYPTIVLVISILVILVMMVFVIPKFEEFLIQGGKKLPWITQQVVDISHFFQNNIIYILAGMGIAVYSLISYYRTKEGRRAIDYMVFNMPLFGPLLNKIAVARFARTMQTLLSSGVILLEALEICRRSAGNAAVEDGLVQIKKEIEQGDKLSNVMRKIKYFPSMATQMVSVGENTGNIDKMLDKVADWYEEESKNLINNMTKLIEPAMIVVLGGIVGGMLIAMYMPVFQMAGGGGQ